MVPATTGPCELGAGLGSHLTGALHDAFWVVYAAAPAAARAHRTHGLVCTVPCQAGLMDVYCFAELAACTCSQRRAAAAADAA
jgi:hypothetical protein